MIMFSHHVHVVSVFVFVTPKAKYELRKIFTLPVAMKKFGLFMFGVNYEMVHSHITFN